MLKRIVIPALFGVLGTAVLVSLGIWQLNRAEEKAALIAEIEAGILAAPVPLPDSPDPERDRYLPVTLSGRFTPEHVFLLAARRTEGPGFHLISALETEDGRRVLVERGFLREAQRDALVIADGALVDISGNLHWPRDVTRSTPPRDVARNLVFGRDVSELAQVLQTEALLVVLRRASPADPVLRPVPVDQVSIPDNHLGYAVQWFLMAIAWAGMTLFFLWRITRQPD